MSAKDPLFPLWLRWALIAPFSLLVVVNLLAIGDAPKFMKELWLLTFALAAMVAVVAVPTAIFLLLRGGYFRVWNMVMTVAAALPLVFAIFAVFLLKYGHFHI